MTLVEAVPATGLAEPLALLEESLRSGEPVPPDFVEKLSQAVLSGDLEALVARNGGCPEGVLVLAFRLNISAGAHFASIEDLYVRPEARRRGVGRALLEAADERCAKRGVSYVEVQVDGEEAEAFYTARGYASEAGIRVLSRSLIISET